MGRGSQAYGGARDMKEPGMGMGSQGWGGGAKDGEGEPRMGRGSQGWGGVSGPLGSRLCQEPTSTTVRTQPQPRPCESGEHGRP